MRDCTTVIGLDVHKKTIVAAVLPPMADRPTETTTIENYPKAIEKLVTRVSTKTGGAATYVYEAGPCGYDTYRQISRLGQKCVIIAPSLIPVRPGDRVKTDRRDAEKLARYYRAGELTEIRVPSNEAEAARDLVRAREDVVEDRLRARHRLAKFLLRQGRIHGESKTWGVVHRAWLKTQRFEWPHLQETFEANMRAHDDAEARLEALNRQVEDLAQEPAYRTLVQNLRCLKGINTLSAVTLAVEAQDFRRFERPGAFMSFSGLVSSEFSSGEKTRRGSITKAGNAHIRRVLGEAAWSYRYPNVVSRELAERRKGCPKEALAIAKKAQDRLHRKFRRMTSKGKIVQKVVTAVARELAGFVWSMGQQVPAATA